MRMQTRRSRPRRPLLALAVGSLVAAVAACADGAPSPSEPSLRADAVASHARAPKASVCHRTGNGEYRLLEVSGNALSAHLAHGDAAPGAPVPDVPGAALDDACGVLAPAGVYDLVTVDGHPLPFVESSGEEIVISMTLTLLDDGRCSVSGEGALVGDEENVQTWILTECTYSVAGTEVTMTVIDDSDGTLNDFLTGTFVDGTITVTNEEGTYAFVRR